MSRGQLVEPDATKHRLDVPFREALVQGQRPRARAVETLDVRQPHIDLGLIRARHGETEASLLSHATDLDQLLSDRYPDEHLTDEFHQRYQDARTDLRRKAHADS
jgi:hypothetical protein